MKARIFLPLILSAGCCFIAGNLQAQDSVRTYVGTTGVQLSTAFTNALKSLNVTVATIPPAISRLQSGLVEFPIVGGIVDLQTAHGQIVHTGGLELQTGNTIVTLTDYIIDTSSPAKARLNGIVTANGTYVGRIPLFDLALPSLSLPIQPIGGVVLIIPNVGLTLNPTAAEALNKVFQVTAFSGGLSIGSATLTALVSKL
jgi:uncharacterized membrane protein YgdD (TMEM256/DUF423 family)